MSLFLLVDPGADAKRPAFTPQERGCIGGLTALLSLRMLGFYLVLPILTPYAESLPGSTPLLVGLSVGIYGLTQTLLQVPFGTWSDRWGRRPVMTMGLGLFALGSVICAIANSALVLVLGRLVQGMGAIASVVVAILADLTREKVRARAMAAVGIAIGGSFSVGLVLGPTVAGQLGVSNLFWLTAVLSLLAIGALWWKIPAPPRLHHHEDAEYSRDHAFEVLSNPQLLRLDWSIFILHMALTAIFVTFPFLLQRHLPPSQQWQVFLPLLSLGLVVMFLGPRFSEQPGRARSLILFAQVLLLIAMLVIALAVPGRLHEQGTALWPLLAGLALFIVSFALLEPLLPSLLTRLCQQVNRGTAAGIFNMSQFSGAFVGGLVAGLFLDRSMDGLFLFLAIWALLAVLVNLRLEDPEHMNVVELPLNGASEEERHRLVRGLMKISGVEDVAWQRKEQKILVRYADARVGSKEIQNAAIQSLGSRPVD